MVLAFKLYNVSVMLCQKVDGLHFELVVYRMSLGHCAAVVAMRSGVLRYYQLGLGEDGATVVLIVEHGTPEQSYMENKTY